MQLHRAHVLSKRSAWRRSRKNGAVGRSTPRGTQRSPEPRRAVLTDLEETLGGVVRTSIFFCAPSSAQIEVGILEPDGHRCYIRTDQHDLDSDVGVRSNESKPPSGSEESASGAAEELTSIEEVDPTQLRAELCERIGRAFGVGVVGCEGNRLRAQLVDQLVDTLVLER